jgi:hypothetical protein
MRATSALSTVALATVLLASCSGGSHSPASGIPLSPGWGGAQSYFHRVRAPSAAKTGIYVSSYYGTSIYGFKRNYRRGHGPICAIYTRQVYLNDIAADEEGNLIVPRGTHSVVVYAGPDMCGSELGEFRDPYGDPVAAASINAATGTILVVNLEDHGKPQGNIAVCALKSGCTQKLKSAFSHDIADGIALAKNGDCWLASEKPGGIDAGLTYWKGCTGAGKAATGFMNGSFGSLSIDKHGNLLSIDHKAGDGGELWVYSGCDPACTVVGGPFRLEGTPFFGALNEKGDKFGVMESAAPTGGTVDIYKYAPTKLTYLYSFDSSFALSSDPYGFAFSPALRQ